MDKIHKKHLIATIILIVLYFLLSNSRSAPPSGVERYVVSMIIPVLGGILFSRWVGFWSGILGTFASYISPAGQPYELLLILPHGIIGFIAGYYRTKIPSPLLSCTLFIGHILDNAVLILFNLISFTIIYDIGFWIRIAYQMFFGVVAIMLIAGIFRLGFENITD